MFTRLQKDIQIEDLRNHPAELITSLRNLLAGDAKILPDQKRDGFYEVEDRARTYYIHVSPVTGKILLLAAWPNEDARPDETQCPESDARGISLRGNFHPGPDGGQLVSGHRDEQKADPSPPSAKSAAGFGMTDHGSCAVNV
jgi:hypothetical protein